MANKLILTASDLSGLEIPQRRAPVEYEHWPARLGLDGSLGELAESPASRSRAVRGAVLGIVLGAAIYGVVLTLLGVIKL